MLFKTSSVASLLAAAASVSALVASPAQRHTIQSRQEEPSFCNTDADCTPCLYGNTARCTNSVLGGGAPPPEGMEGHLFCICSSS